MKTRFLVVVAILALAVAGCGSSKKTNKSSSYPSSGAPAAQAPTGNADQEDAKAKADARTLETEVEACFVDQQDYTGCKKPTGTKSPLGSGPGQVEVSEATTAGYTIVAHSKSGTSFKVVKDQSGKTTRTCDKGGQGGCPAGGSW